MATIQLRQRAVRLVLAQHRRQVAVRPLGLVSQRRLN
jgi:hypothetical protein